MTGLAQDLCYALRQLRGNPGFAKVSILAVALGMCASIAIFGFVDVLCSSRCRLAIQNTF